MENMYFVIFTNKLNKEKTIFNIYNNSKKFFNDYKNFIENTDYTEVEFSYLLVGHSRLPYFINKFSDGKRKKELFKLCKKWT